MALKPVLKLKVDELFLRWLSEQDTQQLLKDNLHQLVAGDTLSQPSPYVIPSPRSSKLSSPRHRPSSPPCSPPPSKLQSPRSPRRPLVIKNNYRLTLNGSSKELASCEKRFSSFGEEDYPHFLALLVHSLNKPSPPNTKELQLQKDVQQTPTSSTSESNKDLDSNKENDKENINNNNNNRVKFPKDVVENRRSRESTPRDSPRDSPKPHLQNSVDIPQFYFPFGKPKSSAETEATLRMVAEEFNKAEGGKVTKNEMGAIMKICGLPFYWKGIVFNSFGGDKNGYLTFQMFAANWRKLVANCHDEASQFVRLLAKPGCNYLEDLDFVPLIQDVVDSHPGLNFLLDAPEFHSRYVNTVIARIFYCVNRSWTEKITINELRRSNFLEIVRLLKEEDDINQITDYFSYEHFYVVYCKFWELDKDHDLYIDRSDLARHNEHAISSRVIDRIFSGAVTSGKSFREGKMSYPEFVWFLISEEDKRNPTSIEYWFRCMDIDGDGYISMYEMEYFYEEQMQKMEALGIEKLPFEDALCQMLDLVRPKTEGRITLSDLKTCRMTNIFFDTFFNLDKFLEHEQRDPFTNTRDLDSDAPEPSDWDRYAAEEYEILVAEEGANEQDEIQYEDDFEPDEELESEMIIKDDIGGRSNPQLKRPATTDDIYDFKSNNLGY